MHSSLSSINNNVCMYGSMHPEVLRRSTKDSETHEVLQSHDYCCFWERALHHRGSTTNFYRSLDTHSNSHSGGLRCTQTAKSCIFRERFVRVRYSSPNLVYHHSDHMRRIEVLVGPSWATLLTYYTYGST